MKDFSRAVYLLNFVAAIVLTQSVYSQAPDSIAGRTLQLNISSGSFPFADSGSYRFLPSATDNWYAVVPLTANVAASDGTYSYAKTGTMTARLVVSDSLTGTSTVACSFTSSTTGTYVLTNPLAPGSQQTGTFKIFAGAAPQSIAGMIFTVTVTSGEFPLADSGVYRFITAPIGSSYVVEGIIDVDDSNGTYAYSKNSATTGLITVVDSAVGSGASQQLSFDTGSSGTIVWRLIGSTAYQTAIFTMVPNVVSPSILVPPVSQPVIAGGTLSLSVFATGTAPLVYQWLKNGTNLAGRTLASLSITNVQVVDAGSYSVRVSNSAGSVTSESAEISVLQMPSVVISPSDIIAPAGTNLTLMATVSGTPPFTYRWRFNGDDIPGATGSTYAIGNAQTNQSGAYSVSVSNPVGSMTSANASLVFWIVAVNPPTLTQVVRSGTNTIVQVAGVQRSAKYRIQKTPNMTRWADLVTIIGGASTTETAESISSGNKEFYRVVSP